MIDSSAWSAGSTDVPDDKVSSGTRHFKYFITVEYFDGDECLTDEIFSDFRPSWYSPVTGLVILGVSNGYIYDDETDKVNSVTGTFSYMKESVKAYSTFQRAGGYDVELSDE